MSSVNFAFSSLTQSYQGTSPFTIVFQPSGLGFASKVIYGFPDKTVTRVYTFATSADALTGIYKDIDVRAPLAYTFPGDEIASDGSTTYVVSVTAFTGPSFTSTVYTISANILLQHLTQNPTGASSDYAFEEVHLLKTRVWGPGNSQLIVLETKNPSYLLLGFNQGNEIPAVTTVTY